MANVLDNDVLVVGEVLGLGEDSDLQKMDVDMSVIANRCNDNLYLLPCTEASWCTDRARRTGGAGGTSLVDSPTYKVASWSIVTHVVLSVPVANLCIAVHDVATTNVLSGGPNKLGKMSNG